MMNFPRPTVLLFLAALVAGPVAASEFSRTLFTVGTSTTDPEGAPLAYLAWQAEDSSLLEERHFAIYAKAGPADSLEPYVLLGITRTQTDARTIESLLARAAALGDDLPLLEERLDSLFEAILPSEDLSLSQKLAAAILGASLEPRFQENLEILARLHPTVNLALGLAFVSRMTDTVQTFEVRDFDVASERVTGVLGRVTVTAGVPVELPAPGMAVAVPLEDARGHLNVRLRWATPDPLRRLSLLQSGFNLYRVPQDLAEANNLHGPAPDRDDFLQFIAGNPGAVRVNEFPVSPARPLTATEATDGEDLSTYFLVDDNRRFAPGGVPFIDGESFYYFVSARDILGRDGAISAGTLVTICGRLPPLPPRTVRVENQYTYSTNGGGVQTLRISWLQDPEGSATTQYHVYRWTSPTEMHENAGLIDPASGLPLVNRIAGPIPHLPGREENSYNDAGAGAPGMPEDAGVTYWYTVRTVEEASCGPNVSGNSAPAWGVLRDRDGPEGATGSVRTACLDGEVAFLDFAFISDQTIDFRLLPLRLTCETIEGGLAWAEFYGGAGVFLGRREFPADGGPVHIDIAVPAEYLRSGSGDVTAPDKFVPLSFFVACRVGTADGFVSEFAISPNILDSGIEMTEPGRLEVAFFADLEIREGEDCDGRHTTRNPRDNTVMFPEIVFEPSPGSWEYKIYRSIDGGPLAFIAQGTIDDPDQEIEYTDEAMPASGGTICYYVQLFDEHGNAGPMTNLDCVEAGGVQPLPQPLLMPPVSAGDWENPQMTLTWFCPPAGVDRFEILLADESGPVHGEIAGLRGPLSLLLGSGNSSREFGVYQTVRARELEGEDEALFTLTLPIREGRYRVAVRAVGRGSGTLDLMSRFARPAGPLSNIEDFLWIDPPEDPGIDIPWPARPLPPADAGFLPELKAVVFPLNYIAAGVGLSTGIRIGDLDRDAAFDGERSLIAGEPTDPARFLYRRARDVADANATSATRSILPFVLYRYQLPTERVPNVSAGVIQVSPLIEQIAHELVYDPGAEQVPAHTVIHDPFIAVVPRDAFDEIEGEAHHIYLLDRHPVLSGAKYRYLLVRFREDGEIDRVIPTNEVELP